MTQSDPPRLVLASSSPWRRELLARLGIDFEVRPPAVDEARQPGEAPIDMARRLARRKAEAVAADDPAAVVIGADQVADVDGEMLGKPGSRARAVAQLRRQSGRTVAFHSGVCVCAPAFAAPASSVITVTTRFRRLSDAQINRYVDAEDVRATAGSLKAEGLGIALVESIDSDDPTALIGLPLITVRRMLDAAGIVLP